MRSSRRSTWREKGIGPVLELFLLFRGQRERIANRRVRRSGKIVELGIFKTQESVLRTESSAMSNASGRLGEMETGNVHWIWRHRHH